MSAVQAPSSASDAVGWIRDRLAEFRALDRRILDDQHTAAVFTGAQPAGSARHAAGRASVEAFGALLRAHQAVLNKWDQLVPELPAPARTLGSVPVIVPAIAAAVIAVAASMAWIFGRVTAEEETLRALRAGEITPEQAIELTENIEPPPPLVASAVAGATLPLLVAAAAAAYLLLRR